MKCGLYWMVKLVCNWSLDVYILIMTCMHWLCTGELVFEKEWKLTVTGLPCVHTEKMILVRGDDQYLYAYNLSDSDWKELWRVEQAFDDILLLNDYVFGMYGDVLQVLSIDTGNKVWSYQIDNFGAQMVAGTASGGEPIIVLAELNKVHPTMYVLG